MLGRMIRFFVLKHSCVKIRKKRFKKRYDMLSQCLVVSITKKVSSHSLVLGQQPLIALQIQNFH